MEWVNKFWNSHGERLTFLFLANAFSGVLVYLKLISPDEAKVIFVGSMALCFNKARGTNGKGETDEKV